MSRQTLAVACVGIGIQSQLRIPLQVCVTLARDALILIVLAYQYRVFDIITSGMCDEYGAAAGVDDDDTMNAPPPSKYAVEMVRYGNGEIHTIGSIMGGITAQELIKIITYQYVPIRNTYVYNGITSTGAVYNLS